MKSKYILLLAVIMGGITTLLFNNYMKTTTTSTAMEISERTVEIVVALESFEKNERISVDKLELRKIPETAVFPQSIMSKEELEGLFVNADIEQGEALLRHRVQSEADEQLFISRKVKEGYRAVSVSVNYVESVSTLIEPEDLVDIIFSEENSNEDKTEVKTSTILNEVRVLAVGKRMVERTSPETHDEYSTVTFELVPGDAEKLINATERGRIHLMLNSRVKETNTP